MSVTQDYKDYKLSPKVYDTVRLELMTRQHTLLGYIKHWPKEAGFARDLGEVHDAMREFGMDVVIRMPA